MGDDVLALVEALRVEPSRTAILLDFDGTLAPVVDDPARAVPLPGAFACLAALQRAYGVVAVVSGRPVSYLQPLLPAEVTMIGLYGLERVVDGAVVTHPDAPAWRPTLDDLASRAALELPVGVGVEHKGLSLTLHVRQDPDLAAVVQAWATAVSLESGLHVRRARMSAELHPPVAVDKGTVVSELLDSIDVACFIGDDVGDLPAFDALDAFAGRGNTAVRFVVDSSELDPGLRARADAMLDGPVAVLELLGELLA